MIAIHVVIGDLNWDYRFCWLRDAERLRKIAERRALLWGFVATLVLTTIMAGSQGLRLTRMNVPYMLGAMFTPNRDLAKLIGPGVHVVNGWLFSLLYIAASVGTRHVVGWGGDRPRPRRGRVHHGHASAAGAASRMASEQQGPTVTRQLEPPGVLALNYGYQTPSRC